MPDGFENARGEPTNAVYGFTGFLCSLLEQAESGLVGVAFDVSLTTSFRNEIYPEYKANRDPAPVELKRQFAWARQVAEAMGLKCYGDERFEADDIIGTLADCWKQDGHAINVVTGDKDLAQLIGEGDHWWDFARNRRLAYGDIAGHFGVHPEQIADYLALTGDAVDNIPGVPGVGPKTAAALLSHFGSLDAMWGRLPEIQHLRFRGAKTLAPKLEANRAAADLARRLTGIETAVPSALADPEIRRSATDEAQLDELFNELAFGGMLRQRCLACR